MGNRGKGSKGKLTKKGKGGKGRKGGGGASKKWGDESAGRGEDEGQKMKKKRRLTQVSLVSDMRSLVLACGSSCCQL